MASYVYFSVRIHALFLLRMFLFITMTKSNSFAQKICQNDEISALLQFKKSLSFNESASRDPFAYQKLESWKIEGETNHCCLWDGVECEKETGHVIGLDLSSSFISSSISSTSSLFSLVHLQRLNLADNHFNYSQIPSSIGRLINLTALNLSTSRFTGQIPFEIPQLTRLESLDLSKNQLILQNPSLETLVQNLTGLKELSLSEVNISSPIPTATMNLSSLRSLFLDDCGLNGEFPASIFYLPNLQFLSVNLNGNLTGYLPEFCQNSPLKELSLVETSFYGKLPDSIGTLNSLNQLHLRGNYFSGPLPASLNNLTGLNVLELSTNNFTGQVPSLESLLELSYLSLSLNKFDGVDLPWLGKLTKLSQLYLYDINLYGEIPSSLVNLTQLTIIRLGSNHLSGRIPSWLTNLTQLTSISLANNLLKGPIPSSFSQLKNLEYLNLHYNNLSGTVQASTYLGLKNLTVLQLSYNNLSLLTTSTTNMNATYPKLKYLGLSSFSLTEIPDFIRFQDELEVLFLERNEIRGQIPEWIWNRSEETMGSILLSYNFLTGFERNPVVLPWAGLKILELRNNMLQGSLPAPPPNTLLYHLSNNKLTGEIPPLLCQASSLYKLDLSNNELSGKIPPCLGNFSGSLFVLNLKGNKFNGTIPETHTKGSNLRMMDLSQNRLEGQVPRSLANCTVLEVLDLGDNRIEDTFPYWLGGLSELQILILQSNKFHGAIGSPTINSRFSKLRIIDLSNNGFTGNLPLEYFEHWDAMKIFNTDWLAYMQANITFQFQQWGWNDSYPYSMTITNKGVRLVYEKILNIFTAVDLSSNKFKGQIPESITTLKGLQLLNLSNNDLAGSIPPSFWNLTELESLDLSRNKFTGEIPQSLQLLTFLAFLNVSFNQLSGPIPHGKQFDTFQSNSYEGNLGLCGDPLSKKCGDTEASPPPPPPSTTEEGGDYEFPNGVDWVVICMGYGSGSIVGLIIGHNLISTRRLDWFVERFPRRGRN